MKVWVVTKGQYSDMEIVAIKSNEEAAERLKAKCSYCHGTGQDPYFNTLSCYHCVDDEEPQNDWNETLIFDVEDN